MFWPAVLWLNIKCWTSSGLKYIRWPGLFTTRALRKHRIRMDFIIYIVSFTIFHKHFIRIFPSAFYNPHFYHPYVIICTLSSVFLLSAFYNPPILAIRIFYYPHFVIRMLSSACCHQHFIIRNYSSACWALHGNNSYQQGSKLFVWEINKTLRITYQRKKAKEFCAICKIWGYMFFKRIVRSKTFFISSYRFTRGWISLASRK